MSEEIRWGAWEAAPVIAHLAERQGCESCSRPGPMAMRFGYVRQPGRAVRKLVERSDVASGVQPRARTVWLAAYWALVYTAFRCPGCREEVVVGADMEYVERLYRPPREGGLFMLPGGTPPR